MKFPVNPRKRLGQNFMTDERALSDIADSLSIAPGETVLEIGPGPGALTKALLSRGARVIAVEKDPKLAAYLNEQADNTSLEVHCRDILGTDIRSFGLKGPVKVAGNIPYNITSPIIEWLIGQREVVTRAVLTVQWEVAQRLAAKPGGRDWGSLTVFLQFYADVELLRKIDKSRFFPSPKVDSGVLRVRFLEKPRHEVSEALFFRLVRKAFQKRRKTILNALADRTQSHGDTLTSDSSVPMCPPGTASVILSKDTLNAAFAATGIDPQRRPETLGLAEWASLTASLGSVLPK